MNDDENESKSDRCKIVDEVQELQVKNGLGSVIVGLGRGVRSSLPSAALSARTRSVSPSTRLPPRFGSPSVLSNRHQNPIHAAATWARKAHREIASLFPRVSHKYKNANREGQ